MPEHSQAHSRKKRYARSSNSAVTTPVLEDGLDFAARRLRIRSGRSTFLHSGLKNVGAQTGSTGAISAERTYDAFGAVVASNGTFKGPHGYGGAFGYRDDASGLKLLGHRMYSPELGRFLSRDPIRDGRNWYVYCGNNPVSRVDADGLILIDILILWSLDHSDWWTGTDWTDKNGHPVRVGGWPALINPEDNAMTYDGTVHISDQNTFYNYMRDDHWQNHEEGHIEQGFSWWRDGLSYGAFAIIGAFAELNGGPNPDLPGGPIGHGYNPWEIMAERYAVEKEGV